MKVAFRTDASVLIGSGHVVRDLTLADGLRQEGAEVHFVCRAHKGALTSLVEAHGFPVTSLPLAEGDLTYDSWLGASQLEDASETAMALARREFVCDWLVADHYAVDATWEEAMRPATVRIMAIDDLANRSHRCDLLLDQNLVDGLETRYDDLVPSETRLLLGPRYALLQPGYDQLHVSAKIRGGAVQRILVYFGASDLQGLTRATIAALLALDARDLIVDVVVGPTNQDAAAIAELTMNRSDFRIHCNLPSLAPLMATADLAIGASGATSWERLCMKLPSLVVTLADNQRDVAAELHRQRQIIWLGDSANVTSETIEMALRSIIDSPTGTQLHFAPPVEVDGLGARRVVRAMLENV